jgi:hypothetical protein
MKSYQEFYDQYRSVADIYIVYILEAHFVEKDSSGNVVGGWPIGHQYNHEQPKTLEQRKKMVDLLIDEYHPTIPILMDTMENQFQQIYHPWPDRAFVFKNGVIEYIARLNDDGTRNSFFTDEIAGII